MPDASQRGALLANISLLDNAARSFTVLAFLPPFFQSVFERHYADDHTWEPSLTTTTTVAYVQMAAALVIVLAVWAARMPATNQASTLSAAAGAVVVGCLVYFGYNHGYSTPGAFGHSTPIRETVLGLLLQSRQTATLAGLAFMLVHIASPYAVHGTALPMCCGRGEAGDNTRGIFSERRRWIAGFALALNIAVTAVVVDYGEEFGFGIRVLFAAWQAGAWLLVVIACLSSFDSKALRSGAQLFLLIGSSVVVGWIQAWSQAHYAKLAVDFPDKHYLGWPQHAANVVLLFGLLYAVVMGTVQLTDCGGLTSPERHPDDAASALLGQELPSMTGLLAPGGPVSASGEGMGPTHSDPATNSNYHSVSAYIL